MPQFVILHHRLPSGASRGDHFDLMLEDETSLLTWALLELPSAEALSAEELPPHRREYLTYEGPISNQRGEVQRVVAGTFEWRQRDEFQVVVELTSPEITGRLTLQQRHGRWQVWLTAD